MPIMEIDATYSIANLLCATNRGPLWLLLCKTADAETYSTDRIPLYHCSCEHQRLLLPSPIYPVSQMVWKWMDVYISPRDKPRAEPTDRYTAIARLCASISPPFRIRRSTLMDYERRHQWSLVSVSHSSTAWTGFPPVTLVFMKDLIMDAYMTLTLGRCNPGSVKLTTFSSRPSKRHAKGDPGPQYAFVRFHSVLADCHVSAQHTCPDDHIAFWPGGTRVFVGTLGPYFAAGMKFQYESTVAVKFTPSPLSVVGKTMELQFEEATVGFPHDALLSRAGH